MNFASRLIPRRTSARAVATWSDSGFETAIKHEPRPSSGTLLQRLIERSVVLKSAAFTVRLGDLELFFAEPDLLTSVGMYGPLLEASLRPWEEAATNADPVSLTFPGLSADEHVHSLPCVVSASVDNARGRMDVRVGPIRPSTAGLLADDLLIRIDDAGSIAGFQARGATWTDDLSGV
jgi:hypothetical protein